MSKWPLPAAFLALLLALAAIAPASAAPPCGVGSHADCPTPDPTATPRNDPDMAVIAIYGFETQANLTEGIGSPSGTAAISTVQARTGAASFRVNPASGASGTAQLGTLGWVHFGLYIATMPSVARVIDGLAAANTNNLLLNTDGTLAVRINTTVTGTSAVALVTGRWYWIGVRHAVSATGVLLQVDGVDQVSGTTGSTNSNVMGCSGTEASAIDLYYDDVIDDDAGYLNPSRAGLAVPISDVSRTDWTNDAAGTTLWSALNSKPPTGIADTTSGSGTHQVRDATNGNDTFVVNLTTYASLGLTVNDKVLAVQTVAATGAPSATSPKSGSLTVSNPTIAIASMGTFYNGSAIAGTFPTGWAGRGLTITTSPTVTIANSPQITVTQDTSSTRIAMMCFLGLYVAWTPGALGKIVNVNQAVARAANY